MVPTEDYSVQACWRHTEKRLDRLVVTATSRLETILVHGRDFGQLPAYAFKRRVVMQQSDCSACMKKSCINPGHRANILRQNRVYTVYQMATVEKVLASLSQGSILYYIGRYTMYTQY